MRNLKPAVAVLACLASVTAAAQPMEQAPPSLFGIQIGQKLSLPNCVPHQAPIPERATALSSAYYYASPSSSQACLAPMFGTGKLDRQNGGADLVPGQGAYPDYVDGNVRLAFRNGMVESILYYTNGVAVQKDVLGALQQQFGAPLRTSVTRETYADTPAIEVTSAIWTFPDGTKLVMLGSIGDQRYGTVTLSRDAP